MTDDEFESRRQEGRAALNALRPGDAAAIFRALVSERPDHPGVRIELGVALSQAGDQTAALVEFSRAADLAPDDPFVHVNMGLAFERAGLLTEAETAMRVARGFAPDNAAIVFNLANVARKLGRAAEAEALYREVIARDPHAVAPRGNLASLLLDDWRLQEARSLLRRAEEMAPEDAAASFNLANAERMAGDLPAAIAAYERALDKAPDWPEAHFNLGFAALLAGDWRRGWKEFAWRWGTPAQSAFARRFDQPRWTGEEGRGRTLLLRAEQGLGDTIQFVRYAPMAQARGWRVILEAPATLMPALARTKGIDAFAVQGAALPEFDAEAPLLDLPGIFGTTPASVPADIPYVTADPARVAAWEAKLGAKTRKRIGLVWGGNPDFPGDRWRSPGLKPLLPLLDLAHVEWIGLQVGPRRADMKGWTPPANFRDVAGALTDMGETAALLANLDTLVTSCTSTAHLAGAMGLRTHLLLSYAPDWRWMLGRADTPWYPTLVLHRQVLPGDWQMPVREILAALR
ncbi:MAG: tetratricopeptide repeat protein [Tagaea sp.]